MVQGTKKLAKAKAKLNKHSVEKANGHNSVRVGLKKAAKKPGRGKGNTSAVKINKKLVSVSHTACRCRCTGHCVRNRTDCCACVCCFCVCIDGRHYGPY